MKVTTNTPELLIVEERPWILGIAMIVFILIFVGAGLGVLLSGELWGLVFILVGGGLGFLCFSLFVRRVQVVFYRPEGWVEIRRRSLFGHRKLRHGLGDIEGAIVETSRSDNSTLYRVTLDIPRGESEGRYPLTRHYTNIGDHEGVARAINAWLEAR